MKRQGCYIVLLDSSGKMLCSFITDAIVAEGKCGECLCETKSMRDCTKRQVCYIALLESSGKVLCFLCTDPDGDDVECGDCLYEAVRKLV